MLSVGLLLGTEAPVTTLDGVIFSFSFLSTCSNLNFCLQGGDNFAREFKQLRRSFRFNEYKSISDVNPPRNFLERVSLALTLFACTVHRWSAVNLCMYIISILLYPMAAGITCARSAETCILPCPQIR